MPDDIVDRIDELVDAQLEQEPSGYDHDINQHRCPHCGRDWHGLAITERMEEMRQQYRRNALAAEAGGEHSYAESAILDGYRYDEDDSRVLCPGSTFIGPRRPTRAEESAARHLSARREMWSSASEGARQLSESLAGYSSAFQRLAERARGLSASPRWWRLDNPPELGDLYVDVDVEHRFRAGLVVEGAAFLRVRRTDSFGDDEVVDEVRLVQDFDQGGIWMTKSVGVSPEVHARLEIHAVRPPNHVGIWQPIDRPGGEVDDELPAYSALAGSPAPGQLVAAETADGLRVERFAAGGWIDHMEIDGDYQVEWGDPVGRRCIEGMLQPRDGLARREPPLGLTVLDPEVNAALRPREGSPWLGVISSATWDLPEPDEDSPAAQVRQALERRREAGQSRARQLGLDRADRRRR